MADRRFPVHTESRATNTIKTGNHSVRDDVQTLSNVGANPSSAIAATAAATGQLERRQSVFRRLSMSMGSRKSSMLPYPNQARPNNYRVEPDQDYRFRPYRIQSKVLEILVDHMKDRTYQSMNKTDSVKEVSRNVLQLMKHFQMPRYKIIVQTVISEKLGQLVRIASRCLWDAKTDNMMSVNYETQDMFAVVTVYGVYLD
jgi:tctex1 domain-containing protein 2